jgi:hypothetical protein
MHAMLPSFTISNFLPVSDFKQAVNVVSECVLLYVSDNHRIVGRYSHQVLANTGHTCAKSQTFYNSLRCLLQQLPIIQPSLLTNKLSAVLTLAIFRYLRQHHNNARVFLPHHVPEIEHTFCATGPCEHTFGVR